jgi:hypothetical protein
VEIILRLREGFRRSMIDIVRAQVREQDAPRPANDLVAS